MGGAGPRPPGLHPAFRVLLLVALAAMLFRYSLVALVVVEALLLGAAAAGGLDHLQGIWRSLRRIRWLLLSIAVIYLWVAPEPTAAGRAWYLPSQADLVLALRRAGVLVVLVTAVELLKRHTPAAVTAAGLVALLRPLAWLGMDTAGLARRIALTLDAVPGTAERVAAAAARHRIRRGLAGWGEAAAALIHDIEAGAAAAPARAELPDTGWPPPRDWLLLAAGVALCIGLGAL